MTNSATCLGLGSFGERRRSAFSRLSERLLT